MLLIYDKGMSLGRNALSAAQSHHCSAVLRMSVGQELLVGDGKGAIYKVKIVESSKKICIVETVESIAGFGCQKYGINLAIAPTKNFERVEWAVEKAVEIGVDSITPILTSRCERKVVKYERLEKIVASAAGQSLKAFLPTLNELTDFEKFVAENPGGLIPHCNEQYNRITMPKGEANYTILIGPEGDFSPSEVEMAVSCGYRGITLGNERLRTETAAIYALIEASLFSKM